MPLPGGRRSVPAVALFLLVVGLRLVPLKEALCGAVVDSSARPSPLLCGLGEVLSLVAQVLVPAGLLVDLLCSSFASPGWSPAGLVLFLYVVLEDALAGRSC